MRSAATLNSADDQLALSVRTVRQKKKGGEGCTAVDIVGGGGSRDSVYGGGGV